jgi:sulfatase maturation enzyme AslB (radical SAM superfamily)
MAKLDLLISEACNFGCGHCIYFSSIDSGDDARANKIMKFDQAKKTIDTYVEIMSRN